MDNNLLKDNITILPIDELQISLSEKYIKPNIENLFAYLYDLRDKLDVFIQEINSNTNIVDSDNFYNHVLGVYKNFINKKKLLIYPIGACFEITSILNIYLELELKRNTELSYLKLFVENGGVFKIIWGQQRHEYYQTAIQLGSYYVNVANDTTIITNPKVKIKLVFDSGFSNIGSLKELFKIKEIYHEVKIFPNIYYPEFALIVPFFFEKEGQLFIKAKQHLLNQIISPDTSKIAQFFQQNEYLEFSELSERFLSEIEAFFNILRRDESMAKLLRFELYTGENWNFLNDITTLKSDKLSFEKINKVAILFNNRHILKSKN